MFVRLSMILLTYSWALQPFMGLDLADDPLPYSPILGCRFHILDSGGFQVSLMLSCHLIRSLPLGLFPSGDFSQFYDSRVITTYNVQLVMQAKITGRRVKIEPIIHVRFNHWLNHPLNQPENSFVVEFRLGFGVGS